MTHHMRMGALLFGLMNAGAAKADVFLDLTSVTPGGPGVGAFSGSLGGIIVTGNIGLSGPPASFFFNAATPGAGGAIGDSTTDNLSPQYSYASVYSSTTPLGDRVGWSSSALKTESIVISFSSPVTNPVFHVANLDWAQFSFAGTPGLLSLSYLNGNFDGTDGLDGSAPALGFGFVQDFAPATADGALPAIPPPLAGPRSAYGSIRLNGAFTTITIGCGTNGPFSDTGSFTLSAPVPEPGSLILTGLAALGLGGLARRRWRKSVREATR